MEEELEKNLREAISQITTEFFKQAGIEDPEKMRAEFEELVFVMAKMNLANSANRTIN